MINLVKLFFQDQRYWEPIQMKKKGNIDMATTKQPTCDFEDIFASGRNISHEHKDVYSNDIK